ncbi:hypothetical protein N0V93_000426 [Gnomoniopsis smithogilvyi]|uniref:Uncharacterized protein n=1 Tax=Gnomoniopsis smithogilvyi TaxID=1191159 RepID=A0A9W8Z3Z6_9PEZI|nr:hypothetical protein N0V93_000426 [Gnomoniopsis smithogilvyi]
MSLTRILVLVGLTVFAEAAAIHPRGTIASDQIVGFPQTVPSGTTGTVYEVFQPLLHVANGCVPFPGVNAAGDTNAGLDPTGATNGGCSSNTGQIYVRGASSRGLYALMYSWYFPKDSPLSGLGHRHDWEGAIVWLNSATSTSASNVVAVCPSQHGDWACTTSGFTLSGTRPLIEYRSDFPIDHAMFTTTTVGGSQPLIAWESLPAAAQNALQTTDFGSANVPFKDSAFTNNLAAATF